MCMIATASVANLQARVEAKFADAIAALEAADVKLGKAASAYKGGHDFDVWQLWEAEFAARLFARMLAPTIAAGPSLPASVFHAIENYPNRNARNPRHLEGGIIALKLAERSLREALTMMEQLDGDAIDAAFEIALAARGMARENAMTFRCGAFIFDDAQDLESLLAGKRQRPAPSRRRELALSA